MRTLLVLSALWCRLALGQIPDQGRFDYVLYDNGDRPVGTYVFTIEKQGQLWRIASEMSVDARVLFLPIRFKDQNSFTHDGMRFQSFEVNYLKDVPLQRILRLEVSGARTADGWTIHTNRDGNNSIQRFSRDSFDEVRNLASRLVRPEAVLRPGQVKRAVSLDPLTLQTSEVESRGVAIESIEFQGRKRELFVMETSASDGNVRVKKFSNGLIYRSQTDDGYALLRSAQTPSF